MNDRYSSSKLFLLIIDLPWRSSGGSCSLAYSRAGWLGRRSPKRVADSGSNERSQLGNDSCHKITGKIGKV